MTTLQLEEEEMQLIAATAFMMQRVMGPGMSQHLARQFLNPHGIDLSGDDGDVICAMLGALQRQLKNDRVLDPVQRALVIKRAQTIITKFERAMHVTPAIVREQSEGSQGKRDPVVIEGGKVSDAVGKILRSN